MPIKERFIRVFATIKKKNCEHKFHITNKFFTIFVNKFIYNEQWFS